MCPIQKLTSIPIRKIYSTLMGYELQDMYLILQLKVSQSCITLRDGDKNVRGKLIFWCCFHAIHVVLNVPRPSGYNTALLHIK